MNDPVPTSTKYDFDKLVLSSLQLGVVLLVIYWSFRILGPFIPLVLWGAIIAVAIYPLHKKLKSWLGNRNKLSATLITFLGIAILVAPVLIMSESLIDSSMELADSIQEGTIEVTPPPEGVKDWPVVGDQLHSGWKLASENTTEALNKFRPQLEMVRHKLIGIAGGAGAAFLQMVFSMIIAGVFLANAKVSVEGTRAVVNSLAGEQGAQLLSISETTVRSVARGVLGVAFIEATLSAIALVVADVPAAGFWTFIILVLSIIQVPPLLILVPMIFYVISASTPLGIAVFVILSVIVILVDTILKPVLLGRTCDAPMLVVLMGAIGGTLLWGIVGLFVGAVFLVVQWQLLMFFLESRKEQATDPA